MTPQGILAVFAVAALMTPAAATDIVWDVTIGRNHRISTGAALPDSFVFELGTFAAGFTPDATNMAEWASRWNAASRAVYDPVSRYFSGSHNFIANGPAFPPGSQAYIWGMSDQEWILIRRPDWLWPFGSPVGGPPVTWSADGTVVAVAGSVNAEGGSFFYRSVKAAALPPPLPWLEWQRLHFSAAQLANPAVSGPQADADGDGQPNVMEYAAGTWPLRASSARSPDLAALRVTSPAGSHLALRFRTSLRAQLSVGGSLSPDLQTWNAGPAFSMIHSASPGETVIRETAPITPGIRRFLRLAAGPQ